MMRHVVELVFTERIRELVVKILIRMWKATDTNESFACFEEQSTNEMSFFLPEIRL